MLKYSSSILDVVPITARHVIYSPDGKAELKLKPIVSHINYANKQPIKYNYITEPVKGAHIVTYKRTSGLTNEQVSALIDHYDAYIVLNNGYAETVADVRKRITQHYYSQSIYIAEAQRSQRVLTEHEYAVHNKTSLADKTSVSHIIANVTVQCMFNHMTLQFLSGANTIAQQIWEFYKAQENLKKSEVKLLDAIKVDKAHKNITMAELYSLGLEKFHQKNTDDETILTRCKLSFSYNLERLKICSSRVITGLANQAAAIARMRGIGRAIINEETSTSGYGEVIKIDISDEVNIFNKRKKMSDDINVAFGNRGVSLSQILSKPNQQRRRSYSENDSYRTTQSDSTPQKRGRSRSFTLNVSLVKEARLTAYINYMRYTVDSVGNLRLGDIVGNNQIGAGFDMPLTSDLEPTERGLRLLNALYTYGLPDFETPGTHGSGNSTYTTGIFSTDSQGNRLSSSRQINITKERSAR